jgi:riboflavin kinase/FMN adenylyltransferase
VLKPDLAPALLTSKDHRLKLLHDLGIAGCLVLPFTKELARVEPEDFIRSLKQAAPGLRRMVVGENWTFGRHARGTVSLLRQLARENRFALSVARPLRWRGGAVSSTRIRDAIAAGRLDHARAMLGRPFGVRGDVVRGKRLGHQLGFPTANVDPHNEVRPPPGIYAAHAFVRGKRHPAAVFLGDHSPIVEAYLIDRDMDLYGQEIEIVFVRRLREERRFASLSALRHQIARDVEKARQFLTSRPGQA